MLLYDKEIEVSVNHQNRKYYENITNKSLTNGDKITVKQKDIQKTSRILVDCECDFCNKIFPKKMVAITGNHTYCNNSCRNGSLKLNNPNPPKEKVIVNCAVCNKEIPVHESKYNKQEHFLCSRDCYKKHRSIQYCGDKIYNYQDINIECEYCNKPFKVSQFDLDSRNHLFCTQECYWNHRKDNYLDFYYKTDLNDSRQETNPEKLVREWLKVNNISYQQEFGFMKKYFIDFYLYEYKVFVEVYGDYWHGNPKFYGDGLKPLNENQIKQKEHDLNRIKDIESHGYKVYTIWENEIYENVDLYMGKIIDNFNKNPQRLHAKPL